MNVRAENVNEFPDHYIYAMAQHMPYDKIAAKFYNATSEDIQAIVQRHAERMLIFDKIKPKMDDGVENSSEWN